MFLLRLFNDGFVAGAFWVATYALICRVWTIGAMAFTWGVGVKMSLLLAAPAVGVVVLQGAGWEKAVRIGLLMVQLQVREDLSMGEVLAGDVWANARQLSMGM